MHLRPSKIHWLLAIKPGPIGSPLPIILNLLFKGSDLLPKFLDPPPACESPLSLIFQNQKKEEETSFPCKNWQ